MSDLAQMFAGLHPYDPARDKPRDVGLGGPSTEYLATEESPDGRFWNIPQIWWTGKGEPLLLPTDQAWTISRDYESTTGAQFPRFDSPGAGAFRAMNRSALGGAQQGSLASLFGAQR